jgi:diaminohydroxyphosphoribosylaminopyrimidine deaminase/5-amino-6-(5-phosphoribosylamino)uracil reductase
VVPKGEEPLTWMLTRLYQMNIGSILVEGGPELLGKFLQLELWDEIRVITNPMLLYNGLRAPYITRPLTNKYRMAVDEISIYQRIYDQSW